MAVYALIGGKSNLEVKLNRIEQYILSLTNKEKPNLLYCPYASNDYEKSNNKFKDLVEIISEKNYNISVLNTICSATKERQKEAESIAKEVEAMIVIGDKHSSNSQKLFEICGNACENTYFIQTLDDLDIEQLKSVKTVGITAGASTPRNIIEEVQKDVRFNF